MYVYYKHFNKLFKILYILMTLPGLEIILLIFKDFPGLWKSCLGFINSHVCLFYDNKKCKIPQYFQVFQDCENP